MFTRPASVSFPRRLTLLTTAALFCLQLAGPTARASNQAFFITTVMKKAANDFESIRAGEKRVEASKETRRSILLNSLSVSGSTGLGSTQTQMTGLRDRQTQDKTGMVSAQLSWSMATWFNLKGADLSTDLQRAALKALRMQLATEAADYDLRYVTSSARVVYLNLVLQGLKEIQDELTQPGQKLVLSDSSRAILSSKIVDYENELVAETHSISSSAAYLEKYLGHAPPVIAPATAPLVKNAQTYKRGQPAGGQGDWQGLPWEELDATFAVPATAAEALRKSAQSPALIQAGLNEKQARNQWYLTVASAGPIFSLTFSRNLTSSFDGETTKHLDSTMGGANVGFQIGAGLAASLRSATILEEAARLDTAAQRKSIKAALIQSYNNMQLAREQLKTTEENLRQLMLAYQNAVITDDASFTTFVNLLGAVSQYSQAMARLSNNYQMTKIQIHGLTGTLLEAIDQEDKRLRERNR